MIMADELEGVWKFLKLTEDEKEQVETDGVKTNSDQGEEEKWLVAKLLTKRSFNKEAMIGTMRIVWRLSKDPEVTVMDENLFLFKFATLKDKQRIIDGSPWSFEKKLLVLKKYDGDLRASDYVFDKADFWVRVYGLPLKMLNQEMADRIGRKIGSLIETDHKSRWGKCLRIRVNMDVTKPLRRFVMLTGTEGRKDWWGRLAYERLPMFCYECGIIGHADVECSMQDQSAVGSEKVMQYGDWLRASPVGKSFNRTYGENHSRSNRFPGFESNVTSKKWCQTTQAAEENEKEVVGDDRSDLRLVATTPHTVARNLNFEYSGNPGDNEAIITRSITRTKDNEFPNVYLGTDKEDFLNEDFVEIITTNEKL